MAFGCVVARAEPDPATPAQTGSEVAGAEAEADRGVGWWLFDRPADQPLGASFGDPEIVTLRVGGTLREEYEGYRNFELGVEESNRGWDDYHLHRLLVHADLRIHDRVRLFGEFGNSTISGNRRPTSPVDQDEAYLHQAFSELALQGRISSPEGISLRLGRQEIGLGSARLLSTRDGPNIRRSFDAARLSIRDSRFDLDVFAGAEVRARDGTFDNRPDDDVLLWGAYATVREVVDGGDLDLYYLGFDRERGVFDAGIDSETRHTLGARLFGNAGAFDYNVEAALQLGSFGDRDILAWTIASDIGLRLGDGERAPRLGLRANAASGGHSGGTLGTFNALFPNNSYFSEAAIFVPANLFDVNPTLTVQATERLRLMAMWDFLWRFDLDDAIYSPPGVPLIAGDSSGQRFIGHSVSLVAEYDVASRVRVFASYTHFEAGGAVKEGGGRDQDYFMIGFEWSF